MEEKIILDSVQVNFFVNDDKGGGGSFGVYASPNEAFALMSMPCFFGMITSLVPIYDDQQEEESFKLDDFREALSEMPKE